VDRSGVAPLIERLLRPNRRGRPRQLSVRTLFVGMKLAVDTSKTACLTDVHSLLTDGLAPSAQRDLGVIDPRTGAVISLHQVRRLLSAVQAKLDPSPATAAGLASEQLEERAASLQEILDLMLAATMPVNTAHTGGYAVDGTGTWSWAKGRKREDRSPDPDAAWGVKTHKSGRTETYFGYELHAVVRIGPTGADGSDTPCLAERIAVVPASTSPTRPVLDTLARMTADGHRIRDVVADRGYTYKNDWAPGLHALGIDPVADLHANQYGPRGTHAGARIVAGTPHCPAMPAAFDTIHRPDRLVQTPALDTFTADIQRREQWALRRVAGPDRDGKERYECPARAGKLRCPLQPGSLALPLANPTVLTPPDIETAPTCCSQRTITVPGEVDAKARQRHYWGSPNWIKAFNRRSRVEGWFGNLKNDNTEALGRGAFRVMGICKTSLMVAVFAVATNLRLLRAWARRTLGSDDLLPLLTTTAQQSIENLELAPSNRATGPPPPGQQKPAGK
ncbi:MAG: hypothetical protein M3474_02920, partial [Actinomycetota bacterium]|nr:hypothetical protein [Actinomycetota bacterium]